LKPTTEIRIQLGQIKPCCRHRGAVPAPRAGHNRPLLKVFRPEFSSLNTFPNEREHLVVRHLHQHLRRLRQATLVTLAEILFVMM
jgi:hypothetical protein